MAQEAENPGSEYHQPGQRKEAEELRSPAPEITLPAGELGIDRRLPLSAEDRKAGKRERQRRRHKLLKKMVYAAAAAAMVVGLSQNVEFETRILDIYIDGIMTEAYLGNFSDGDGDLDASMTFYGYQTAYTYYSGWEIAGYTETVSEMQGGYEVSYLPISAMETEENISFDVETYTLTLKDYKDTSLQIYFYKKGLKDTLTIRLEGENEIGCITIDDIENIVFTGSGSLAVTGVDEIYNAKNGTYNTDSRFEGSISISAYGEDTQGWSLNVYVEDGCSVNAESLIIYSQFPLPGSPLSGNVQWTEKSERSGQDSYRVTYENITPRS